jgi:hypothetical protein
MIVAGSVIPLSGDASKTVIVPISFVKTSVLPML